MGATRSAEVPDFDELPRSRAGFAGLVVALYAAAGVRRTWPALAPRGLALPRARRAGPRRGGGRRPPADGLPALARRPPARARPRAVARPVHVPAGVDAARQLRRAGPSACRTGRCSRRSAPCAAWNTFVLLHVRARRRCSPALAARRSGCRRGAALVGGLVFALAPYRVAQSTGHLLGPISLLLPLALLGRSRSGSRCRGSRRRARVDPALGAGASRARRDPVLRRVRARPHAGRGARCCAPARPSARRRRRGLGRQGLAIEGSIAGAGRSLARGRALTRPTGRTSHAGPPAARRLRERSSSSAGVTPLLAVAGLVAARPGRGARASPPSSGSARRSRCCSRSARTSRPTSGSGATSRRSATRACPSG